MDIEIEYYEYECSGYCTPNGCKGHTTDIPVAIMLRMSGEEEYSCIKFEVEGYSEGDYPATKNNPKIEGVREVINGLLELISKETK